MTEKLHTFCRVCEPSCGLVATVENGEIQSLQPDKEHPVTKGFACHKGLAMLDIHRDPDRAAHPTRRNEAGGYDEIPWNQALNEIAQKLNTIKSQYGVGALASYNGNPLAFNSQAGPAIGAFLGDLGIRKVFSSGTQDCTNKFAGSEAVYGSSTIHPIPDIEHSDYLLIFGANPRVSHMSFVSIADPMAALRAAKKRGAKIRFVDPRINESVKGIGECIQVRPDSDVYLMASMLDTMAKENLFDQKAIAHHGSKVEELLAFVSHYPAERTAEVTGIKVTVVQQLARDFASAASASVYMSTGVNMGRQGTVAYWLLQMLSFMTGNLDKRGGNIYSLGFYPAAKAGRMHTPDVFFDTAFGEMRRIRGVLPGARLQDYIEAEQDPIRALIVISGNPLLSMSDSSRMRRAFEKLELLIVIDIYQGATGEYADYMLPATDMFEREDINICGLGLQAQPFIQHTARMTAPKQNRREERWILARLSRALNGEILSAQDNADDPNADFGRIRHMVAQSGLDLDQIKALPASTAVLPALTPGRFYSDWIQTDDALVDCYPKLLEESVQLCTSLFDEMSNEQPGQLKMISRRTNYMINSWFNNVKSLKRGIHQDNPLYLNPEDARARNIGEGSKVKIHNKNGALVVTVSLDDTLKPGVVALTHGWGNAASSHLKVASAYPGVNANDLLPSGDGAYEKISNQSFMTGIPVAVEAL